MIDPSEKPIKDFLKKCFVAIEWNSSMIEEEYNATSNEILRHKSVSQFENDAAEESIISLEHCLEKYHESE